MVVDNGGTPLSVTVAFCYGIEVSRCPCIGLLYSLARPPLCTSFIFIKICVYALPTAPAGDRCDQRVQDTGTRGKKRVFFIQIGGNFFQSTILFSMCDVD